MSSYIQEKDAGEPSQSLSLYSHTGLHLETTKMCLIFHVKKLVQVHELKKSIVL